LAQIIARVGGGETWREQTGLSSGALEGREGNGKLNRAKNRPQVN